MTLISGVAVFFVVWWLCLFVVLPFGIRSQHEGEDMLAGSDPGAPIQPMLLKRAAATTLLAVIVFGGLFLYFNVYGKTLEDLLF